MDVFDQDINGCFFCSSFCLEILPPLPSGSNTSNDGNDINPFYTDTKHAKHAKPTKHAKHAKHAKCFFLSANTSGSGPPGKYFPCMSVAPPPSSPARTPPQMWNGPC